MSERQDEQVAEVDTPPLSPLQGIPAEERVTVFGPASLSNLGPGFDALGLCLGRLGDRVEAWRTEAPGVQMVTEEQPPAAVPLDPASNTAAVAAAAVLRQAGAEHGVALRLEKGLTVGSGIGSSAASAVAGAWAANLLLENPLDKTELVEAVLEGEEVASKSWHGDNVLPALFGGLVLVSTSEPTRFRRVALPHPLPIALLQPELKVLTRQARAMLPAQVPLEDAIHNAGELAHMVDAFRCGDWEAVGRHMMRDRLVEPLRASLVPCYAAVRQAALDAGAYGCALTGSGPAMFALTETSDEAEQVLAAMLEASRQASIAAEGCVTHADAEGVRQTDS